MRFGICAAALWFVLHGVTLNDHVILKEGGVTLIGTADDAGDHIVVHLLDGREQSLSKADLARDDRGDLRISYGLKTAWRHSTPSLLLLALGLQFPVVFLQAIRLQWLLRVQRIHIAYWECVKFSFAGNFLNFATPLGSNAGDVFKAYFVTTHTQHKTEAAATILLDRLIGLGTLVLCVAAITVISGSHSRVAGFRPYVLTAVGLGVAVLVAYRSPALRKALDLKRWFQSASRGRIFEHLYRVDNAARTLVGYKKTVAAAVLVTALLQGIAICGYFTVAVALSLRADAGNVLEFFAYFYTGTVIQALPGPPQGLGTVELAYRYLFAPFGSPSQIVCVAFAIRLTVLVCSLPGLLVTLTGSYKPRPAVPLEAAPAASKPGNLVAP